MERIKTERMVCIGPYIEYVQKTVDIHPPKTGISVHFSD